MPMPDWTLTKNFLQIQYSFGGKNPVDTFGINYMSPGFVYDATKGDQNNDLCNQYRKLTSAEAAKQYGIVVKRIVLNLVRREQEWFIPWKSIGTRGFEKKPATGTKMAFVAGYNDLDSGSLADRTADGSPRVKQISWGGRASPYQTCPHAWGDILLGGPAEKVIEIMGARKAPADSLFEVRGMGLLRLSDTLPAGLKRGPKDQGDYLYGRLVIDYKDVCFATSKWPYPNSKTPKTVDAKDIGKTQEPKKKPVEKKRLFILDANLDGDLSTDAVKEWKPAKDADEHMHLVIADTLLMNGDTIEIGRAHV
jgi:hypothetical protein